MAGGFTGPDDPKKTEAIGSHLADKDALIVCHGAPRIDAQILSHAPRLKIIGELEGDRFAARIDLNAAWGRGVCTVDTTNGSSTPSPNGRWARHWPVYAMPERAFAA